jgi:hypothetical protein
LLGSAPGPRHGIATSFSAEEQNWLEGQFEVIDAAFQSVSVGKGLLHEFAMHARGSPVSKTFLLSVIATGNERAKRIANTQVRQSGGIVGYNDSAVKIVNARSKLKVLDQFYDPYYLTSFHFSWKILF